MKQIRFPHAGEPSVMELVEVPDPEPGPGQVRVKVEAAGVNFADLMARLGMYPDAPPFPMVVGYEVSGVIEKLGEGVDASRLGTPVICMTRFGGYSTHVVVDDVQAASRPATMSAAIGAAIPVTGLTAWIMLEEFGRVREGDRVLVHSAGGGVGLAALDLIKYRGATAVGTASPGKHAFLKERGYDQLIDYRSQDFEQVLADGPKFDLILDAVGGESWAKGLRLLHAGGRLVCFGMSSQVGGPKASIIERLKAAWGIPWRAMNPVSLINGNKGVCGVNMGRMWDESERVRGWLDALMKRWEEGHLRPVVHAEIPFSNAAEAHALIHRRENVGKVILVPDP